MHWSKPLSGLVVAAVVLACLGALAMLVARTFAASAAIATVALVAFLVAGAAVAGGLSARRLSSPYW